MRSQTVGIMSFGNRVVYTRSSKQKLNAKNLTDSEIIGVSEYLSFHIWLVIFLEKQGYIITLKKLYQDNQSVVRLKVNG